MSITSEVIILFLVVLVGVLCRWLGYFTDEAIRGVTQLVVNVTVPCLMVANMQRPFETRVLAGFLLTLAATAVLILLWLLITVRLFKKRPHGRIASAANLVAFSNCGFMGYPIILAINPDWMIYAVAYNIAYSFVSWTAGVSLYRGRDGMDLRRALLNPSLIGAVIGFAFFCLNYTLPKIPGEVVSMLGNLTTPLTMLLIGTRVYGIRPRDLTDADYHLIALLRLIVTPVTLWAALRILPFPIEVAGTLFILTAMPCGSLTAMQAELYGGDSVFASRAIAYTTLLSLLTVPVMSFLL